MGMMHCHAQHNMYILYLPYTSEILYEKHTAFQNTDVQVCCDSVFILGLSLGHYLDYTQTT